jgi:glycosyltransferase involved in cell wall biosynthesis
MTEPLISVFINTYNHEQYIEQAIASVVEQDCPASEVEILVVDDGSADNTPTIIKKFGARVRSIRKENGGQISAYNIALPELRGQIVAFLDGDDWWPKEKLGAIVEAFEAHPGIAAVGHGFYEVSDIDHPPEMYVPEKTCLLDLSSANAARFATEGLILLGTSRLSVRRRLLDRVGPLPEGAVFFDAPVYTLALASGGALVLERPLCYYRRHARNLWSPVEMDASTQRRRLDRLGFLLGYTQLRLVEFGVPKDIVDAFLESPRLDCERGKLQFGEAQGRWNVFRTESRRFRAQYKNPSLGYRLFQCAVYASALILPPRHFYRLLDWYGRKNLKRYRDLLGKPKPKLGAFLRRRPARDCENYNAEQVPTKSMR